MVISRALVCMEGRNPDQLGPEALTRGPRGRVLGQLPSCPGLPLPALCWGWKELRHGLAELREVPVLWCPLKAQR